MTFKGTKMYELKTVRIIKGCLILKEVKLMSAITSQYNNGGVKGGLYIQRANGEINVSLCSP